MKYNSDTTGPTLTVNHLIGTSSTNYTYVPSLSYAVVGTVSDSSGVEQVTVNGTKATLNGSNYTYIIKLTANKANKIEIIAKDKLGNTSTLTRYAYYDSTDPIVTITSPTGTTKAKPYITTSNSVTVKGTVSDTGSGVSKVTVNGVKATLSGTSWSCNVTLSKDVLTELEVVAIDKSGRQSYTSAYACYDTVSPVLDIPLLKGSTPDKPAIIIDLPYELTAYVADAGGIASVTITDTADPKECTIDAENNTFTGLIHSVYFQTQQVTVTATDYDGNSTSVTGWVYYEMNPFIITVEDESSEVVPIWRNKKLGYQYTVTGTYTNSADYTIDNITINGSSVTFKNGTFSKNMTLSDGYNNITVEANSGYIYISKHICIYIDEDYIAPTVTTEQGWSTDIQNPSLVPVDTTTYIDFDVIEDYSGLLKYDWTLSNGLSYSWDGEGTFGEIPFILMSAGSRLVFSFDSEDAQENSYFVFTVNATDVAGNTSTTKFYFQAVY